jgi:hypothetical protein
MVPVRSKNKDRRGAKGRKEGDRVQKNNDFQGRPVEEQRQNYKTTQN